MERRDQEVGQLLSAGVHIMVGLLFAVDGLQKLTSALDGSATGVAGAIIWIAGVLELVGGGLVAARARAILVSPVSNSWPLDRRTTEGR